MEEDTWQGLAKNEATPSVFTGGVVVVCSRLLPLPVVEFRQPARAVRVAKAMSTQKPGRDVRHDHDGRFRRGQDLLGTAQDLIVTVRGIGLSVLVHAQLHAQAQHENAIEDTLQVSLLGLEALTFPAAQFDSVHDAGSFFLRITVRRHDSSPLLQFFLEMFGLESQIPYRDRGNLSILLLLKAFAIQRSALFVLFQQSSIPGGKHVQVVRRGCQ